MFGIACRLLVVCCTANNLCFFFNYLSYHIMWRCVSEKCCVGVHYITQKSSVPCESALIPLGCCNTGISGSISFYKAKIGSIPDFYV